MDKFFEIVKAWDKLAQFFFFAGIVTAFFVCVEKGFRYLAIILRGWPPEDERFETALEAIEEALCDKEADEDDEEEDD